MAHGRPWYKRNGADLVMATLSMPDAETKWAYSAFIDMLNDRDRPLADDPGFICGFTGLSKRKWGTVRAYLIAEGYLVETGDGHLTNPRFERERAERQRESAEAVENGRRGGRKSAALRAAGQSDLAFIGETSAEKEAQDRPINATFREDNQPITKGGTGEINDLAEPPPQAPRAGASARQRREARDSEESSPTSNPVPARESAVDAGDDPLPIGRDALLTIVQGLARAGGVTLRPERPQAFARELDQAKAWITDGIDIDRTVLPAIAARIARIGDETVSSLKFYDGDVRRAHARTLGKNGKASKPLTPEQLIASQRSTVALYRRMGRHAEADEIEAKLPPDTT